MRKRHAAMIAIVPLAGLVTACGDTRSSGSSPEATPVPAATAEVLISPSPSPSGVTAIVTASPAATPSRTPAAVPTTKRPKATATTPAMPGYRPPTVGKPIIPTDPLTPPPPFIDESGGDDRAGAEQADDRGRDRRDGDERAGHGHGQRPPRG